MHLFYTKNVLQISQIGILVYVVIVTSRCLLFLPCGWAANLLGKILTFLYVLGFVLLLGLCVTNFGVLGVAGLNM